MCGLIVLHFEAKEEAALVATGVNKKRIKIAAVIVIRPIMFLTSEKGTSR